VASAGSAPACAYTYDGIDYDCGFGGVLFSGIARKELGDRAGAVNGSVVMCAKPGGGGARV
jgi:hypothetical protein